MATTLLQGRQILLLEFEKILLQNPVLPAKHLAQLKVRNPTPQATRTKVAETKIRTKEAQTKGTKTKARRTKMTRVVTMAEIKTVTNVTKMMEKMMERTMENMMEKTTAEGKRAVKSDAVIKVATMTGIGSEIVSGTRSVIGLVLGNTVSVTGMIIIGTEIATVKVPAIIVTTIILVIAIMTTTTTIKGTGKGRYVFNWRGWAGVF